MTKKKLTSIVIIGISLIIAAVVLVTHKSDIAVTHSADLYIDDAAYESIVTSRMPSELPLTMTAIPIVFTILLWRILTLLFARRSSPMRG